MCCGGTCVRAVCEYHRHAPPTPQEKPRAPRAKGITLTTSLCGHYVRIWRDGQLIDEVPA